MEVLRRGLVRNCICRIFSKRERLRKLGYAGREGFTSEALEDEFGELLREIDDSIGTLQGAIENDDLDLRPRRQGFPGFQDNLWSLGAEEFYGQLVPFLRGNLQPIRRVVVAPALPENVVFLFLAIPGLRETLTRENHGHWGYHYHYLDAKKRRSDTLLTFDRKLKVQGCGQTDKIVTWEKHSEASHFKARAATWGDKKRQSVYEACVGDSTKRNLNDFKKPGKDAEALWPV